MSTGGVFVQATDIPAFGTRVTLQFEAPGMSDIKIPGIVRWTKVEGFGVQFQLLGARETHALALLVGKNMR
jgi:Tfp pilus assembly protein PilZ